MKLALIGYGKMGREVAELARERGHEIAAVFDIENKVRAEAISGVEVCIDFSAPGAVLDNILAAAQAKKNMVVGTTGWYDKLDQARRIVSDSGIGLIYAPNFSIGVNMFFRIVAYAAELFNKFADYDPYIIEIHHGQKLDSPSGTALHLANMLIKRIERKREILARPPDGRIRTESLHVTSVRAGYNMGEHTVGFDSPYDILELKHAVRSRRGFAAGALMAAEWIRGKRGLFTFDDVLTDIG